ncbi:Uncharacterised protein [Fusobacterium necrogenes]|uniref:Salt-induced outer membrane protein n=1 Tax=Fusobacterium necrogenes TaxID=858 RepID=A0A377GXY8_9FUSO|nr:hypothetical protein [Fusobacterium necrogenes]STO31622.1 Uncharacterised protein [Fusobacterium necrogenes]
MKKIALLLAAMGIVSIGAAAEGLKVTNFGQTIEIENTSGKTQGDIGDTWLFNNLGMTYGDWTFTIIGGKMWTLDSKDGVQNTNSRLEMSAVKNYDSYYLGAKTRFQQDYDRYHLLVGWNYGNVYGDYDVWYESLQGRGTDAFRYEIFPIGVKFGDYKIAWYVEGIETTGTLKNDQVENYISNQLRFYAPIYTGEKISFTTEYRLSLNEDIDYKTRTPHKEFKDFRRHRLYLRSNYAVSESLSLFLNYGYQVSHYEAVGGEADTKSEKYWGDVELGWSYKF